MNSRRCGLCVGPGSPVVPVVPSAASSTAVLPRITAPAARKRAITLASSAAMRCLRPARPSAVGKPATSILSLIATARPSRRPIVFFALRRSSLARAAPGAVSSLQTKAARAAFSAAIASAYRDCSCTALMRPAASQCSNWKALAPRRRWLESSDSWLVLMLDSCFLPAIMTYPQLMPAPLTPTMGIGRWHRTAR